MSDVKTRYRRLCDIEPSIPIFSRAWWLDAAAGEGRWQVVLVEKDGKILAAMPYVIEKKLGLTLLTQPPLTQTLGPWLYPGHKKSAKPLSEQKELMDALISQLPPFDHYGQRWHYSNTNWLPFYWSGFEQTTRYTYVIDDLSDLCAVFKGFSPGKRKDIKKAERSVRIQFDISAEEFYDNHQMTLAQQGATISYSLDVFKRIYESGYRHNAARTIAAFDEQGNLHAALFVVWDENSAYDLVSTIDHDYRNSGAATLLVREIIKHVATKTRKFDFEGSMIEPVEYSFRQFNTIQVPYFSISKTPSRLYATARFVKSLLSSGHG